MQALSTLALVIQKIARADTPPRVGGNQVIVMNPFTCATNDPFESTHTLRVSKLTAYVDSKGRPTKDAGTPAIPQKRYSETFGQQADLRSAISAASKAPGP